MLIVAVMSSLVLGFVAGLFSFKVKDRWCPQCGATTRQMATRSPGNSASETAAAS